VCENLKENRRSLHSATPDFLLSLVALAIFMRLSLTKAAHLAMSSAAWQEIRIRSGRDDNFIAGKLTDFPVEVRGTADPSASLLMNNLLVRDGNELEAEGFGLLL
jgi:uncharacterized protein YigA (DUF484 family)